MSRHLAEGKVDARSVRATVNEFERECRIGGHSEGLGLRRRTWIAKRGYKLCRTTKTASATAATTGSAAVLRATDHDVCCP